MKRGFYSDRLQVAANQHTEERNYWLNKLSGDIVKSSFPVDNKKDSGTNRQNETQNGSVTFTISGELFVNLDKLSSGSDKILHMILMAGLVGLLGRYTGNSDILIGTPVYKQESDCQFINTLLVIKNQLDKETTFKSLLKQMRETIIEATKNQNYPVELIPRDLNLPGSPVDFPLFDTVLLLHSIHDKEYIGDIKPNIIFIFKRAGQEIAGLVEYQQSKYLKTTIEQISTHFVSFLRESIANLDVPVGEVDFLSEQEKQHLLMDFNNIYPAEDQRGDMTIHNWFCRQAAKITNSRAVSETASSHRLIPGEESENTATYGELDKKSDQLASQLRLMGVKRGDVVGLMIERSIKMVIGLIAILKAGAAYLPVDPAYPRERKEYMLKDCRIGHLLVNTSQEAINYSLPADVDMIDLSKEKFFPGEYIPVSHDGEGSDLLYVIYTSGSTGKPKGVMLEHRNLVNLLNHQYRYTNLDFSRVLQFAAISFDVSFQEVFSTLLAGGELFPVPNDIRGNVMELFEVIKRKGIKTVFLPAAFLRFIFSRPEYLAIIPGELNHIISAGEQLVVTEGLRQYLQENSVYLHNHYGPSETHVVTSLTLSPDGELPGLPTIGKPILNTRIYILDREKRIQPIGVQGEMYIGGPQVGRGYWGMEELTSEKFPILNHPPFKGERLYRSGDLARWLQSGNIEFLGRCDHQVKIRGFRIELGEIETRLLTHSSINEAVVTTRTDNDAGIYLCAYIVCKDELLDTQLRDFLAESLPGYMIPAFFYRIEKIPMTPNAKIDYKALLQMEFFEAGTVQPPADQTETMLVKIWADVLGEDPQDIGVNANFFQSGGHSLNAAVVTLKIHKYFNVNISLAEMFDTPTIRELAERIRSKKKELYIPVEPVETKEYYRLSSSQQRLFILQKLDQSGTAYNLSSVLRLPQEVEREKLTRTFQQLIRRHETFRTSFEMIKGELVQRVHEDFQFQVQYYKTVAGQGIDTASIFSSFVRAFQLDHWPLLRVGVVEAGDTEKYLMIDMPHIISDGISLQVLADDFFALYQGEKLATLRLHYKDFAEWQKRRTGAEGIKMERMEDYWLTIFSGEIPVVDLPVDFPRPAIKLFKGNIFDFQLPEAETHALEKLAWQEEVTLFMLLLAIYNVMLSKLCGCKDIIVGTPVAGRNHADLEKVIGMFVNTLALRNFPDGNKLFRDFLNEIKISSIQALQNQDYSFEDLVDKTGVVRDLSRNPLFDIMFAFQDRHEKREQTVLMPVTTASGGLENKFNHRTATFDISLSCIGGDQLAFSFEYSTELFKEETIARFALFFKQMIRGVLDTPDCRILDLEIMTAEMKKQVLEEFNNTKADVSNLISLPDHLDSRVQINPNAIAASCGKKSLTFYQLKKASDYLARKLRDAGLCGKNEQTVGILMERSLEMMVAILAVWKAGGAYIPLDTSYPLLRINEILVDSSTSVLIIGSHPVSPGWENSFGGKIIMWEGQWEMFSPVNRGDEGSVDDSQCPGVSLNGLAYVIYTSGSTGKPKGVMVEHIGMMNHIEAKVESVHITDASIIAQNASHTFDISVWQFFAALTRGGKTVIYSNALILEPHNFMVQLIEDGVTILEVVPSYLSVMLDFVWSGQLALSLQYLLVTGEAVKVGLLARWFDNFPGIPIVNAYGPTEASDDITHHVMEEALEYDPVPIGKPLRNFHIYIVDEYMKLCPIGVEGEIVVSGLGVGRGYINHPERTSLAFMKDLIPGNFQERLYKTGDLGKWLADGTIVFCGRKDHQVKMRGFRIELSEIESRLLQYPAIREAVVIDRDDMHLCAYYTTSIKVEVLELKAYLGNYLPRYMVPEFFVHLERLPTSANGKIDRKALKKVGHEKTYAPVRENSILTPLQREQILVSFNGTQVEPFEKKTVHRVFEEQVEKFPGAIAVVFGDDRLTYEQLNKKANQMACSLMMRGLKNGDIAAVMTEPSTELIISILAVLKLGCGYLPIEVKYPDNRIAFMLKDSLAKVLLTMDPDRQLTGFPGDIVDIRSQKHYEGENENPGDGGQPESLFVCIYTSGTTGVPKGVMITHSNLVNYVTWFSRTTNLSGKDKTILISSLAYDLCYTAVYSSLLNGACLHILPESTFVFADKLLPYLKENGITYIKLTPSFLTMLTESPTFPGGIQENLRLMVVGGEPIDVTTVEKVHQYCPNITIMNHYGPTESTIGSITQFIDFNDWDRYRAHPTIGRPIFNTGAFILGEDMEVVPIGFPGELCISGSGLARGYLNRPELTAEKFIENPYFPGVRIYRTGDLATWLPDGRIECLGRKDHQVKIRGFRVELKEIENILRAHQDITDAQVIAKKKERGTVILCAFVVSSKELDEIQLRGYLAEKLPHYMLPSYFVKLEKMPLIANGKLDRKKLEDMIPESTNVKLNPTGEYFASETLVVQEIVALWKDILGVEQVGIDDNFFDSGANSLDMIKLHSRLSEELEVNISIAQLFRNPTVRSLSHYILSHYIMEEEESKVRVNQAKDTHITRGMDGEPLDIAVIGMAGRFPGARDINQFQHNLENGIESISFVSDDEFKKLSTDCRLWDSNGYVKVKGGVLQDKEYFDASFFDYTPSEAEIMDPQVRIFHECAWEALEDAGYNTQLYDGAIGIYAGASSHLYWEGLALFSRQKENMGDFAASLLSNGNFLVSRIAYKFDLKGPATFVQTACSTSLVAIHHACRALLDGECQIALAGGVSVDMSPALGYRYEEGMIMSSDGHCRAFDAKASGVVKGEGAGIVVLKPLAESIGDGDHIYAVIKGSAINNDGCRKVGFTAPSIEGQVAVIRKALAVAGVTPESISYIETHGTATPLGDIVEIEALKSAFNTDKRGFCALGSVKTNIGHLDAAAGVTGFIKTVSALKNRLIPPSLFFDSPNPEIDFDNSPFYVNTRICHWESNGHPLRAGVSSFGIGGTNAHIILEETPQELRERKALNPGTHQLILLSAKSEAALQKATENLGHFLQRFPHTSLADLAYTLQVGRREFKYRRKLLCSSTAELINACLLPDSRFRQTVLVNDEQKNIVFMFPGIGGQYEKMGEAFYMELPEFKNRMDRCFDILMRMGYSSIKEILFRTNPGEETEEKANENISRFEISQLTVFIFEYALAKTLISWGIKPTAVIGYSFGEYTAACLAGVFSLEDALKLITNRGKLIVSTDPGVMMSVPLSLKELQVVIDDFIAAGRATTADLSIAVDNGFSCIVSGVPDAVKALEIVMKEKKLLCLYLNSAHGLHSPLMEPILQTFKEEVRGISMQGPGIPFISNLSGNWVEGDKVVEPEYWVSHLRETVRFSEGIKKLLEDPRTMFIEVGPGHDLTAMVSRLAGDSNRQPVFNLIRSPHSHVPGMVFFLNRIGDLWLHGAKIEWHSFYNGVKRYRIPLPTYPFNGQPFMIQASDSSFTDSVTVLHKSPKLVKKKDISDWFYIPQWTRSIINAGSRGAASTCGTLLVFSNGNEIEQTLLNRLRRGGYHVVTVSIGDGFARECDTGYRINPQSPGDYLALLKDFHKINPGYVKIIHFWNITENILPQSDWLVEKDLDRGLFSILHLVQAISKGKFKDNFEIVVVTNHVQEVDGTESICPQKSMIIGLLKCIPQEYPNINCSCVDIEYPGPGSQEWEQCLEQLQSECQKPISEMLVAYRGKYRWIQTFESLHLEENCTVIGAPHLRKEGVYLITGGLGNIGFSLAQFLVKQYQARLILTGRSMLPPPEQWNQWLDSHDEDDIISKKIHKIQKLEKMGGQVLAFSVDVADEDKMSAVLYKAEAQFGPVNGLIHAAGVTDNAFFRPIQELAKEMFFQHFYSKIYGVLNLHKIFEDRKLDFILLTSSLAPILGGLGFAAYSAANIFMDTFVQHHNRNCAVPWLSVNWGDWHFGPEESLPRSISPSLELTITPDEGNETFRRILTNPRMERVVISSGDLQARIDHWVKLKSVRSGTEGSNIEISHPLVLKPEVLNPYITPRDEVEKALADIWEKLFGYEKIGILDNFFELGGDSLKAITVISKIHKEFNIAMSLKDFFEAQTIQQCAQRIKEADIKRYFPLNLAEKKEYYPLSSAQKRLYILQRLEPGSIGYNQTQTLSIKGEVNKKKLETAFLGLIERHEILRTSIEMVNEVPVQVIHAPAQIRFQLHNIEKKSESTYESTYDILNSFIKPFDLSCAPFMRAGLIKTDEQLLLIIDLHHIITDGFSYEIFVKELVVLYGEGQLPKLQVQYKDYSEWQSSIAFQSLIAEQGDFWVNQFTGEIPLLNLPTDYSRPAVKGFEGNREDFMLDERETRLLKELASVRDMTLFMLLFAIYSIFLAKLSGQEDIVIGVPVAGRGHMDLQYVMGIFVNTLALRSFPAGHKSIESFLVEIKNTTIESFENQDFPFEDIIDRLSLERDLSRNPLFDVMFVLQNTKLQQGTIPDVDISQLDVSFFDFGLKTSKLDLTLNALEENSKLSFFFEYNTKLFSEETVKRFVGYFKKLVVAVSISLEKEISEIEIITDAEKKRILIEFNSTTAEYPKEMLLHQLFSEQAQRTPGNSAVIAIRTREGDLCLNYRQFDKKTDSLAHLLKENGVQPGLIVGIMVERSIEMVMGIFAILKAGGVYLPIAPDYPPARTDYILKDSGITILLSCRSLNHRLEGSCRVINLDEPGVFDCFEMKREYESPHYANQRATEPAYVIYTSGSTGKPKGTIIEHRSVINRLIWMQRFYPLEETDVILQKTSFVFDVSVWEFFWWSIRGAALLLLKPGDEKNPGAIIDAVVRYDVSVMHFVPSMLSAFLEFLEASSVDMANLTCLKYIFASGEVLTLHHVDTFYRNFIIPAPGESTPIKSTKLINLYGPTEATVDVSYYNCSASALLEHIPIGKPIDNINLYVVDKKMYLQPIGVVGELCIAGDGLARGYLNNVSLTEERFINNPFKPGQRIYRTGDLARWLPDGNIEFLGRMDHQVKIKGFRIELGEIEANLIAHPEIKEAVVTSRKQKNGNYLCAYLRVNHTEPDEESSFRDQKWLKYESGSRFRDYLAAILPDYMVPSYFIVMEDFPRNFSGKIDRNALPGPDILYDTEQMLKYSAQYAPPRNKMECVLVKVWESVLGREHIGINENFFMIGGDSIKAIQIVSRMQKYQYKVEIKDIFKYPVISQLASKMTGYQRTADQSTISGTLPLTPIQHEFFQSCKIEHWHYNQAVMFHNSEAFDEIVIETIFKKIQQHHDALRTSFQVSNGTVLQMCHGLDYPFSLQRYDLRNCDYWRNELDRKCQELEASICLEKGPMMKLGLFHADDGDRLLIVIHHLVVDGVSWRILFEDMETLYQQHLNGKPLELPPKTDSYKLWSEQLSAYATNESLLAQNDYWEQSALQISILKRDFDRENYIKDNRSLAFYLKEEDTSLLLTGINHAFGTQIRDILLTALGLSIKESFGNDLVYVALEGHGREEIIEGIDVSRTVGWFTSVYPILLDVSCRNNENSLQRHIKEIKESLHRVPQKGIGYGILKHLTPSSLGKGNPVCRKPQIRFNYLGQFDVEMKKLSFKVANESVGNLQSLNGKGEYELEVNGMIRNNQLMMSVTYSIEQYKEATIEAFLANYKKKLEQIIHYCSSRIEKTFTPSDFTYKGLSIDEVDAIIARTDGVIEDIYPLTPMQEGLLFHALYDRTSSAYFEQMSYRLNGTLEVDVVKKSLHRLVERHTALRTVFLHKDVERPLQLVMEQMDVDFYYEDISHFDLEVEKEAFVSEYKKKDRERSFNLENSVPMRMGLIRTASTDYNFIWSFHHILMDGWCIGILMGEYSEIYDSFLENHAYHLPPVKPYSNYIQWLESRDREKSRIFWSGYLDDYKELAGIPFPVAPAADKKESLNVQTAFLLSPEETQQLKNLAASFQVTLNTVIRTIWGVILAKYNHLRDVVFGAVVSGRPSEIDGIESMVGLFLNTIPVRIRFQKDTTFDWLLCNIQAEAISSEPHHYYPLADIQAQSALKLNLLDHILAFQNFPISERIAEAIKKHGDCSFPGECNPGERRKLNISDIDVFEQSNYNFNIIITASDQLHIEFSYNPLMYEKNLIKKIEVDFKTVVSHILEEPGCTIDSIKLKQRYFPLSMAHERLTSHPRFPYDTRDYNIHTLLFLEGELTLDKLQEAFEKLMLRHESLGANLGFIGNKLVFMVNDNIPFQLQQFEAAVEKVSGIVDSFIQPFPLHQPPLLRAGLIKIGVRQYLLVLDTHCLVADARSHLILLSELFTLYRGEELSVLHYRYVDYLQVHRERYRPGLLSEQQAYGQHEFPGYGNYSQLALPVDFPGTVSPWEYEMRTASFQLEQPLVLSLRQLSVDRDVSLYIVLLAVFNILLSRYGGVKDVVVCTPQYGRQEDFMEGAVGMFEYIVAVKNSPGKEKTFAAFLEEVRYQTARATDTQLFPIELLHKWWRTNTQSGENPLFETIFRFEEQDLMPMHKGKENTAAEGMTFNRAYPGGRKTPGLYKLALEVVDSGEDIWLDFQYAANLLKKTTIEALSNYYLQITRSVVKEYSIRLADIELVAEDKKENIRRDKKIKIEFDF